MSKPWLRSVNSWVAWLVICGLVLVTVALIAEGVARHSQRFDGGSVSVAILLTAGVLFGISTIAAFIQALDE